MATEEVVSISIDVSQRERRSSRGEGGNTHLLRETGLRRLRHLQRVDP